MRVLVVGGTRFLGPFVVRGLCSMGHQVAVYHRGGTEAQLPQEVRHIHGDRKDLADFAADLERWAPEVVLDMIAFTQDEARGALAVYARFARRVVVISSQDVYRVYGRLWRTEPGPAEPIPLAEDSPLRERLFPHRGTFEWARDYDKILVERAVMEDPRVQGTVLRLPMVYGPKDGHRFLPYLKRMDDRRPVIPIEESEARWHGPRGYVENVAQAIVLAVSNERAAGRIYNVADAESLSEIDWIRRIAQLVGWNGKIVVVPNGSLRHKFDLDFEHQWTVDTGRIRRELGYAESVAWLPALQATVDWERAEPPDALDPDDFDYAREDAVLQQLDF